jgi:UDP-N-acetylglucosamine acyltransferase
MTTTETKTLDINQIKEYLPHRYPMLLVDRVLDVEVGKRITAIKNVTVNEEFFNGHFPHKPVMPGVLMIEAMAQTAAILSFMTMDVKPDENSVVYFVGIDNARFKRYRRRQPASGAVMTRIHPSAIVDPKAELDSSVEVGAYSIIGPDVRIDAGTVVGPHVVIEGHTTIGRDNKFFQFSSIGAAPQDKKWNGEPTRLEVGDRNTIREFCTFNLGTVQDKGVTRLGNDNWISAYVHLAHDCQVGSNTIFSNNAQLAGHVEVGDWAILSGYAGVHQFCKIGAHAFVGMYTSLTQDVPPFVLVSGNPAGARGVNIEGLKRRGFTREQIDGIRAAYKSIYRSGLTLEEAKAALVEQENVSAEAAPQVRALREFLGVASRGIVR